jgi:hypothetical protein
VLSSWAKKSIKLEGLAFKILQGSEIVDKTQTILYTVNRNVAQLISPAIA